MDIRILPASHGDCILMSFKGSSDTRKNILIDGGTGGTYELCLKNELIKIKEKGEYIDLLVLTHIDDDHIGGICRWFEDEKCDKKIIKKVWFNSKRNIAGHFNSNTSDNQLTVKLNINRSNKKSIKQAIYLEEKLDELNVWIKDIITEKYQDEIGECKIEVLSPTMTGLERLSEKWESEEYKNTKKAKRVDYKYSIEELYLKNDVEDASVPNESSIALLIEYRNEKLLFLGDAKPVVIEDALKKMGYDELNKIELNLLKVSHHGSRNNISKDLLKIIKCNNYVISTDSQRYGLPDKECMSKIIMSTNKVNLYFNYDYVRKKNIFSDEEYETYGFKCNILEYDKPYELGKEIYICK